MHNFKDTTGRVWSVSVTYGDVQAVERDCGFDLTSLFDEDMKSLGRISTDFALLVGVAYTLCRDQAETLGISPEEFAESMGGDTLLEASKAITEATIDFFPNPSRRKTMRDLVARLERLTEVSLTRATPIALKKMDEAIENLTDEQIEKSLMTSFGSAVE